MSGLRARLMAWAYDPLIAATERRCLAAWRAELLRDLAGDVLEIGAGTGANLPHYPAGLARLLLAEPEPAMRRRLAAKLAGSGRGAAGTLLEQAAERLPLADDSVDHVVSTLVLCSVEDLHASLGEIRRVLRPGGSLHFMEHVVAPDDERLARWQRRLEPAWSWCAGNCHLTRDTAAAIRAAGFEFERLQRAEMHGAPAFVRPMVLGVALLAGCAADAPRRQFAAAEAELDTDGRTTLQSHAASYYPRGVSLPFPGFVVAVDKSPRDVVLAGGAVHLHDVSHAGAGVARDAARLASDGKLLYVSHVHEYTGRRYGDGNCYHYSVYERRGVPGPVPPCAGALTGDGAPPFARGFDALRRLREVLAERLRAPDPQRLDDAGAGAGYTHLVVMVMGWNTPQVQAFRNFGSLMGHLHAAAGGDRAFRPLFVGVTWPSFWARVKCVPSGCQQGCM